MQTQRSYFRFKTTLQAVQNIHFHTLSYLRLLCHSLKNSQHLFNVSYSYKQLPGRRAVALHEATASRYSRILVCFDFTVNTFWRGTAVYSRRMHAFCSTHAPSVYATVQLLLLPRNFLNRKDSEQCRARRA